MPEHLQDMHFAVVNLHINLSRRSDPKVAVVLHFTVSLSVALSNCQPHSVGEEESVCEIEFPKPKRPGSSTFWCVVREHLMMVAKPEIPSSQIKNIEKVSLHLDYFHYLDLLYTHVI